MSWMNIEGSERGKELKTSHLQVNATPWPLRLVLTSPVSPAPCLTDPHPYQRSLLVIHLIQMQWQVAPQLPHTRTDSGVRPILETSKPRENHLQPVAWDKETQLLKLPMLESSRPSRNKMTLDLRTFRLNLRHREATMTTGSMAKRICAREKMVVRTSKIWHRNKGTTKTKQQAPGEEIIRV